MSNPESTHNYQVVMPRLGLTMREGKIIEWLKKDGDRVEKGEPLFSIENEKASLDIESPASGILKIQVPEDQVVPILSPVAVLIGSEQAGGHHAAAEVVSETAVEQVPVIAQPVQSVSVGYAVGNVRATPKARKAAHKAGIDLHGMSGSGMREMVVLADVIRKIRERGQVKATPLARRTAAEAGIDLQAVVGSGPRGMVRREDVRAMADRPSAEQSEGSIEPLSELRSVISRRLGQSWMERPQVTLTTEADATLFAEARSQLNRELEKQDIKVSFNALLIKIVSQTLDEFPYMNVSMIPEGIYHHSQINIGLAVDTQRGLMVPVVKKANRKTFASIQAELDGLVARTLNGSNKGEDLSGGTFTITNLGTYEIDAFTPVINPPECAILGIGRIQQKPVGLENQIVLRSMMALSLSFDHRLVDGAPAARFLQRIKQYVEQPFLWTLWKQECD